MIDGIKIMRLCVPQSVLLGNSQLDFQSCFSYSNGDFKEHKPIYAYHRGLSFRFIPMKTQQMRCELNGSLHRYFNTTHNGDDFSVINLLTVLDNLVCNFNIDLFKSMLNNVEFGVNIRLSFPVRKILNSLICLNGTRFEKSTERGFDYYQAKFSQHVVKLYDKGKQIDSGDNILRVELKVLRMQFLHNRGINITYLADLVNSTYHSALGQLLNEIINNILFDERTINYHKLTSKYRDLYLAGRCPAHWTPVNRNDFNTLQEYNCHRTRQQREEKRFRIFVDSQRPQPNWLVEMTSLIRQKWNALTALPTDWISTHQQSVENWNMSLNASERVANLPTITTPVLSQIYTLNVGGICNNSLAADDAQQNIDTVEELKDNQELSSLFSLPTQVPNRNTDCWRYNSRYVSPSMLRKNPKLAEMLVEGFKKYSCGSKVDLATRVAHNERNRYFNPANNLRQKLLRSINSTSLFTPSDVIRLTQAQKQLLARFNTIPNELL